MKKLFIYCHNQSGSSDASALEQFILGLGTMLSREGHFWIIETDRTVVEVRERVLPWLAEFDPLLIGVLGLELAHGCWGSKDLGKLSSRFTIDG